ncbi:complement factor H isoform X2 [Colius striatus]|uniref:complement factor H isoform X2 n=1 Tax=Colius striatus TaxID=57412 RepID=UPI002B1E1871|nr:complement factor H isoform X2 [Colius striatus]
MMFLGYTALLLCWICCTAERACEEPPPRRVKEVPTETWDKPPYQHGTQVTYRCRPGYIKLGRIMFECVDGAWKQHPTGAECRNKPCGHPGDTQFGSFELTRGNEFVFGARVDYRCNEGYWMVSQRNYRECQADGWSNDIPFCQVAKCLPVEAPENGRIVMTGVFELFQEYSFGHVIDFECNAKYKLVGAKEIICSSNGKWNNDVPQCQEIICHLPNIPHGHIHAAKELYKESEELHFSCDEGYRYGERADVQCTESGWNPAPYCTEIVCFPPRIPHGNFRPQEDSYMEGDKVTIKCEPGYYFKSLTGENISKCTKSGWVPDPSCVEKPCDFPAIENGKLSQSLENYRNYYFPMMFGQYVDYYCTDGYQTPSGSTWFRIVCSAGGWSPEPKCLKKCHLPWLQNGFFQGSHKRVFTEGERVKYGCSADYDTEHEGGEITCTKDDWSPRPRCIRKKQCQNINFNNGYFTVNKGTFNLQETGTYRCHTGFVTPERQETGVTRCQENGWTPPPKCIKSCRRPHLDILNYDTNKTMFVPGDTIEYACSEGYQTASNKPTGTAKCGINGDWSPTPQCLAIECEIPPLTNGDFSPKKGRYRNGDVVKFTCASNYVRVGPASAQCYYFGWFPSPPACNVDANGCGPPPEITNGHIAGGSVEKHRHGDRKQYECNAEFKLVGPKEIECVDGQWSALPSCIEDRMPCGSPSSIPNVALLQEDQTQFLHGDEVVCGCKQRSGNSKEMKIKCLNGEWKPFPLCADPSPQCVLPKNLELVHNGSLPKQKKKSVFRGVITYRCLSPDRSTKQATCVSGKWSPEIDCSAEEATCPPPPQPPRAQQITFGRNYKHGSKIAFSCLKGFQLIGANELTCTEGKWQSPPHCVERSCGSIPKVSSAQIEGRNKEMYEPGETVHYRCDLGFLTVGSPEIICREGNWSAPPSCEDVSCGAAPEIPNGYTTSTQQKRYLPGARVQYECDSNFQMVDRNFVICTNGRWSQPPICRDMTCEPPPEIAGGSIEGVKKSRYLPGESAHYQCWQGFEMMGPSTVMCHSSTWTELPQCKGRGGKCGPPPLIEHGELLSFRKNNYAQGTTLEYKCPSLYVLEGSTTITCANGQWTNPPVCLVACTASEEDMARNNIQLKWRLRTKLYSRSGDFIEFRCKRGYQKDPSSSPFRVQCVEGTIEYPHCKPAKNCTLDEQIMKENNIESQSQRQRVYLTGDIVFFECKHWWHTKVSAADRFRAECLDGVLQYPSCGSRFG